MVSSECEYRAAGGRAQALVSGVAGSATYALYTGEAGMDRMNCMLDRRKWDARIYCNAC